MKVFVSRAGEDAAHAQWVASVLKAAGHSVMSQDSDFRAGSFVQHMGNALTNADCLVAVLSPAYLAKDFTMRELWSAAAGNIPIVPAQVVACQLPHPFKDLICVDLSGRDEDQRRSRLLRAISAVEGGSETAGAGDGLSGTILPLHAAEIAKDYSHRLIVTSDGSTAITGGNGAVRICVPASGTSHAVPVKQPVTALASGDDLTPLVVGFADGTVEVWNLRSGSRREIFRARGDFVTGAAVAPDGLTIAAAFVSGSALLWDTATGKTVGKIRGLPPGSVNRIEWCEDSLVIASGCGVGGGDLRLRMYSLPLRDRPVLLEGHTNVVEDLAVGGRRIASCGLEGAVRVWDRKRQECVAVLKADCDLRLVALSAEGSVLATAAVDRTVRVWDPGTRRQMRTLSVGDGTGKLTDVAVNGRGDQVTGLLWDESSGSARLLVWRLA